MNMSNEVFKKMNFRDSVSGKQTVVNDYTISLFSPVLNLQSFRIRNAIYIFPNLGGKVLTKHVSFSFCSIHAAFNRTIK